MRRMSETVSNKGELFLGSSVFGDTASHTNIERPELNLLRNLQHTPHNSKHLLPSISSSFGSPNFE